MLTVSTSQQLLGESTAGSEDALALLLGLCSTVEIRVCRGQIKADGGDQQKFDDGMREMRKAGIQAGPKLPSMLGAVRVIATHRSGPPRMDSLNGRETPKLSSQSQEVNVVDLKGVAVSRRDGEDGRQGRPVQGRKLLDSSLKPTVRVRSVRRWPH